MTSPILQTIKLQQLASDPKNSVWVFASAGSGKTKILTDRVLRLLLDDVSSNKILCLTFTKVAAAEMQNRINSELAEWILCDNNRLEKKLQNLSGDIPTQNQLEKARILFIKTLDEEAKIKVQTIHSFCQTLIKIFPFEANVRPNFEIIEKNTEKLFLKQARQEVLKKALKDASLGNLIKKINSELREEEFSELVSELLDRKERLNFLKEKFFGIENIVEEIFKNFAISKNETEQQIFTKFLSEINQGEILYLASALEKTGLINNSKIALAIKNFLENPCSENFSNYHQAFFTQKNEPRKVSKEIADNQHLSAYINDQQQLILKFQDKFNSLKIAKNTALLLHFVDQILENYSQLKKQNSFLDYNDLIAETNRLLANPNFSQWIKMKMDSSFDHILIDESQDTNHQQWNIIKALSEDFFSGLSASNKERSIFVVGDEKQSIYSFQGAEPNISAEIFAYFEEKLCGKLQKIELNNSFRSTKNILQAVDKVFSSPERKNAISKVSEFQEHKPIREGLGKVEIWPQVISEEKEKEEKNYDWKIDFSPQEIQKENEILAKIIAQKLHDWVANGRILETRTEPLKYGDFMILLRNRTNGFSENLVKFFHQYQIPFSSISKIKFSKSLLIRDLLSAAKFSLLPQDDLNLACLLKSPIFEISEDDLLEICLVKNSQKSTIYQALGQIEKFNKIKKNLDELIANSQELNCFDFFYFLLHKKNHQRNLLSYFGHESLEILDKFSLSVFDFCQNFSPNLQKFLEFVEKLDPEISLSSNENDCVKVTTIHSAKGLQAPVVILPDCCYNFNQLLGSKEEISWINFDDIKFPIWCAKKSDENQILKKHRQKKLLEAKEEYLRLLYVAMTRPEDELYVGGFGNAKDPECWYEVIKNSLDGLVKIEEFFEVKKDEPHNKHEVIILKKSSPLVTPYLPQSSATQPSQTQSSPAQTKGKLIHKILEIFGKNYREEKKWLSELAEKIIKKEKFLSEAEKKEIIDLTNNFLHSEQFEKLFSGKVHCEIEIAVDKILRRIDLLIEKETEVLIIDYKSDEALPTEIPQQYLHQLEIYKNLVKKIYPTKKVFCAILWIRFLKLDAVS